MTTTDADTAGQQLGTSDRGSRSTSPRATRRRATRLAWLALILSALLELVWATAFAGSEGFALALPAIVLVMVALASAAGLGYALRTVRPVRAFVVWVLISAVVTVVWALLTGVAVANVVSVAALAVLVSVLGGLQLLVRRRAPAAS